MCDVFDVCVNVLCGVVCVMSLMCVCSVQFSLCDVFSVCVFGV